MPIQRHEAFPDQWPALPEGSRHEWLEVPAQAQWWEGDQQDCVQFSITDGDGRQKTYSLTGVRRASKALNSSIWSCGLVVVLAAVSFAAIISILAQHSTQQKVIWGLASAAVTGVVWIGSKVRRGLKEHSKRRRKRRSKALADDTGPG